MATGGASKPRKNSNNSGQKTVVKIFITSYADEFHSEREVIRKQVQNISSLCHMHSISHLTVGVELTSMNYLPLSVFPS